MPNFIPYNYNQSTMVVINFLDQLQPGTFEHAIYTLVENKLDLSVYFPAYKNDDNGRPAYDPAILLKIILFAYSKGITSSREIQWCCQTNIIFKALSCDTVPHYTTIASFVSGHTKAIESVFEQILLTCEQSGLPGHELFAIDGCKMPSNAAKEWSGTFKELEQKREKIKRQIRHHMSEHKQLDKNESRDEERKQRAEQAIDTLNKAHDKIDHFLKSQSPRMGNAKRKTEVKSNITDNESAKMTTSKGTIQGYNGRISKCRHCDIKNNCMRNPESANAKKGHGRQVSFIIEKAKRKANYTDWMKHRIDSAKGKLIYSHRMSVVEPVFGNIGSNKRLTRFSLRGKQNMQQGQWQLYCMVHNIEKLANYGQLAA